jgi:hypothetical protein
MNSIKSFFEALTNIDWGTIHLSRLYDWQYLTVTEPPAEFQFAEWFVLISIILLILVLVYFFYIKDKLSLVKPKLKIISNVVVAYAVNTLIVMLYVFFRTQEIAGAAMRLILLILLIVYLLILVYALIDWLLFLPKKIKSYYAAQTRDKYIPKKNSKKRRGGKSKKRGK